MVQLGKARKQRSFLAREIYNDLRAQIDAGAYAHDRRLPSTRALAAELGVSRTTVSSVYDQLSAEGYISTAPGTQARVAYAPHGVRQQSPKSSSQRARANLSAFGKRVTQQEWPTDAGAQPAIDFRYGDLAGDDFPVLPWKKAVTKVLLNRKERLRYDDPAGLAALRLALQGYLGRARNLHCSSDQIVIVNGSQQAIDLCARVLMDPGDTVVVEDPCYLAARQCLEAAGAQLASIEVTATGLRTDLLAPITNARLCIVTPSHQFPLGSVMSAERRQALLEWASRTGTYIVEDDYDSEYRFDIRPIPPLQALAGRYNVIYVGTLSKTLSPTMRLGYMVVPAELHGTFVRAKRLMDRHSPSLEQEALTSLITSGVYERHVRRMRRRNAVRRDCLLRIVGHAIGDGATIVGAEAGLHVVMWLRDVLQSKEEALAVAVRQAGVGIYPITPLYGGPRASYRPPHAGYVLGYASLSEREIEAGIRRLSRVVTSFVAKR